MTGCGSSGCGEGRSVGRRWRERRQDRHGLLPGRRGERLAHREHQVDPGGRRRRPGIDLKFSDAQQKQENQIKAIRSYIQQKVDVIAFSPVVESGWDTVLKEAKDAKIPVILTDRAVDSQGHVAVQDLHRLGLRRGGQAGRRVAGRGVQGQATDTVNIVELQGTTGSAPANDRKKGFGDVIAADPKFKIIASQTGDFTRAKGKEVMEAFLKANPKIDVLFAHNDDMGLGAHRGDRGAPARCPARTSRSSPIDAVKDGMQALADGKINFIVECNPLLGPQLMDLAKKVIDGETVPHADRDRGDHVHPGAGQGRAARPASTDRPVDGRPATAGAGDARSTPTHREERRHGRARSPILTMSGISKEFPGVKALDDVDFRLLPRRDPRADGRERRRQVDADQGADRRLRHRRRRRSRWTARPVRVRQPAAGAAGRASAPSTRRSTSAQPVGGGEHLHRPRAAPLRPRSSWARDAPPGRGAARPAASSTSTSSAPLASYSLAVQQLVAIARAVDIDGQGADPRRADLQPRRRRGRAAVRGHAAAAGRGHRDPVRHPLPRPGLRDLPTG